MATILDLKLSSQPGGPGASSDPEDQSSGAAAPQAHQNVTSAEAITVSAGVVLLIVFGLHIAERAIKKRR